MLVVAVFLSFVHAYLGKSSKLGTFLPGYSPDTASVSWGHSVATLTAGAASSS